MPARLDNDPDKYIRQIKGKKWQARPYDEGRRENLGTFDTIGEARQALKEYWWGRFKPRLRYTRRVRKPTGDVWIAILRVPSEGSYKRRVIHGVRTETIRLGEFATPEAAHKAACDWLRVNVGPLVAWVMIEGTDLCSSSRATSVAKITSVARDSRRTPEKACA